MKKKNEPIVVKKSGKNTSKTDSTYSKENKNASVFGFTSKKENTKKGTSKSYETKSVDSLDKTGVFNRSESVTKKKETPKKSSYFFNTSNFDNKKGTSGDSTYSKTTRKPTEKRSGKEVEFTAVRKNNQTSPSVTKTVKNLPKKTSR